MVVLQPRAGRAAGDEGCEMPQGCLYAGGGRDDQSVGKKWERTASWRIRERHALLSSSSWQIFRPLCNTSQCPRNSSSAQHPLSSLPERRSGALAALQQRWAEKAAQGLKQKRGILKNGLVRGGWLWGTGARGCLWHRSNAASSTAFSLAFGVGGFSLCLVCGAGKPGRHDALPEICCFSLFLPFQAHKWFRSR